MAYDNKAEQARKSAASHICDGGDLNCLGQGKVGGAPCPSYPTDTMGQSKLGGFQGGNLGTFMGQSSTGGKV